MVRPVFPLVLFCAHLQCIFAGRHALEEYLALNNSQIDEIVEMVRGKLSTQNRITLQVRTLNEQFLICDLDIDRKGLKWNALMKISKSSISFAKDSQ